MAGNTGNGSWKTLSHPCWLIHIFAPFSLTGKDDSKGRSPRRAWPHNGSNCYYYLRFVVCQSGLNYYLPASWPLYTSSAAWPRDKSFPLAGALPIAGCCDSVVKYSKNSQPLKGPCCTYLFSDPSCTHTSRVT